MKLFASCVVAGTRESLACPSTCSECRRGGVVHLYRRATTRTGCRLCCRSGGTGGRDHRQLSANGCGGAVCFASGFDELDETGQRTRALLDAAGPMPVLGPNCYGFLNYLDGVVLWPDQQPAPRRAGCGHHLAKRQSCHQHHLAIAGLPIASVWTVGNQAMLGMEELLDSVLDDDRVTAVGLYLEGVRDRDRFLRLRKRLAKSAFRLLLSKRVLLTRLKRQR